MKMMTKCYIVETNSEIAGLFENLDDLSVEWSARRFGRGHMEITVEFPEYLAVDIEDAFAWFV